ncbi:FMN-binding protein MioC [Shewanella colwelliana]|uniref:FMN-binding protein MioC n=1 Tax=Shewanella colwelliana TaxID=23 RepID=A0A1E5ITV1_SHECO|nr:FMN-binding protein MioC [Shewanella colwelliana]MCZ4338450.1 FMN-binding protein MioC [Shewanella colwelliana]OEG73962.1 FMN-binding protein MioC [Shewanella colwelliana]GIU30767.1 FMN-binding protein MioC [Shewanella colwelliana]
MAKIELLVGTTLGSAEYVADELAAQLEAGDHETQVHLTPELSDIDPKSLWLIVSSTHGAGDLPDNIQPFFEEIEAKKPDLSRTKFALCAIGDSSYDTFCQGPEKLVEAIENCGAQVYVDKIQIDVQYDPIPEEPAQAWLSSWQDLL